MVASPEEKSITGDCAFSGQQMRLVVESSRVGSVKICEITQTDLP